MKICCSCKNNKRITEFNNDKNRADGKEPICRECKNNKAFNRYHTASNSNPYEHSKKPKKCNRCHQVKTEADFYYRKEMKALRPQCKACKSLEVACKKYKLKLDDIEHLYKASNYSCGICKVHVDDYNNKAQKYRALVIDHEHSTGKIRGILCHECNTAIGLFKDNIKKLEKAINYLREHQ